MYQRKAVTKEMATRYKRASKREKSRMLDEFTVLTDYNRSYATWALRKAAKPGKIAKKKPPRPRAKKYGQEEFKALRKVWAVLSMPSGKRLAPYMEEIVKVLERCGELELLPAVRDNLLFSLSIHHRPDVGAGEKEDTAKGPQGHQAGHAFKTSGAHPHL